MFRCTDCLKEYTTHPGYCECGNDSFEEIIEAGYADQQTAQNQYYDNYDEYDDGGYADDGYADDGYEDEYEEPAPPPPPVPKIKRTRSKKSKKKKVMTTFDKVGIGVFVVCIILSILSFIFIGSGKMSKDGGGSGKVILDKNYSIPNDINQIWDNTQASGGFSAEKVDPSKILNTKLSSIDSELNAYLISLAQELIRNWNRSGIRGDGVTQLEFRIKSDGILEGKKIYKFSGNKTLDDSVGLLISSFRQFQSPPSSYNNEIIIISFSSKGGSLKAYFPNLKAK